jgi:hypothetical protein
MKRNDDAGHKAHPNLGEPPDYGIDWRFTQGFGLGQVTFPTYRDIQRGNADKSSYCIVNGQKVRGTRPGGSSRCMTVAELLTPEGGVEAMVARLGIWYKSAGGTPGAKSENLTEELVRLTFARYAEGKRERPNLNNDSMNKRYDLFKECVSKGGSLGN